MGVVEGAMGRGNEMGSEEGTEETMEAHGILGGNERGVLRGASGTGSDGPLVGVVVVVSRQ